MEKIVDDNETYFNKIKSEPFKFITSHFTELNDQLIQERENLKQKIDQHFEKLTKALKEYQQECESTLLTRNLTYYDSINLNFNEKLNNLKETLLLYKSIEFKVSYDGIENLASLKIFNQVEYIQSSVNKIYF